MNYSAHANARTGGRAASGGRRGATRARLLEALGSAVRARRQERGLARRALAEKAGVSERFLVQLETGAGNISVVRLQDVAEALGTTAAELLSVAPALPARGVVALLGLRGAGKSSVGAMVARRLGAPFLELDALVAREAGMDLSTLFEIHGDAYFRRLERECLRKLLDARDAAVVATGGSIVTAAETFEVLRQRTTTVWLRATPRDHWDRVVAQGDARPMKNRTNAMSELRALLQARRPLYALADHVVDTSGRSLEDTAARVLVSLGRPGTKNETKRRSAG